MNTKQEILTILEEKKGTYLSGEQIADQVHITRSAVWKKIKELREDGYHINAATNIGYCLTTDNDIFSVSSIMAHLLEEAKPCKIEILPEVTSTNTLLKEKARNGAKEGEVLIALRQTEGKGRLGRSFYSPDQSGLYLSLLLRPQMTAEDSTYLTTIAAVATARAIEEVTGLSTDIKWVNDLFFHGKKICGILTEASLDFECGMLEYAIVGIGINLYHPKGGFPKEIQDIVGSLYGNTPCSKEVTAKLAASIINHYFHYYRQIPEISYLEEYKKRSFLLGQDILVLKNQTATLAHALDIDQKARLIVQYQDGRTEALSSGEVSIRPIHYKKENSYHECNDKES